MNHLVRARGLADRVHVESAGTGDYQVGNPPDERSAAEARNRGVTLSGSARQFRPDDFFRFDLVVAMDRHNLHDLHDLAPEPALRERVVLLRSFDPHNAGQGEQLDVPDPYGGRAGGFVTVYDLVEPACRGLLDHLVVEFELARP